MNAEICVLTPTANRSAMVQETLLYGLRNYITCSIDVNVYDSSDDDNTEQVVKNFQCQGLGNLTYKRTETGHCLDYKLIDILRNDKELLKYKYIWLVSDSVSIFPEMLGKVCRCVKEDYDLIRLPSAGYGIIEDVVFTESNDWFHGASRNMAHMATTLMNTRLLKDSVDWDGLREKYVGSDDINDPKHGFFFTVGFYLERIAALQQFRGLLIGNKIRWWRESPLKSGVSYWQNKILEVWARSYCETIFALPDSYTDKERIIRESDNLHCHRFGEHSLISLRLHGQFSLREFERYEKYWSLVSSLSLDDIRSIAETPREILQAKYGANYGDITRWQDNLTEIEKSLHDKTVIVYGAGLYGGNVVRKLKQDGFRVDAVAVSDTAGNPAELDGIQVLDIDSLADLREKAVVIVAAMQDTAKEIQETLLVKGFQHIQTLF